MLVTDNVCQAHGDQSFSNKDVMNEPKESLYSLDEQETVGKQTQRLSGRTMDPLK